MSFPTPNPFNLDPNEYPFDSQKRQEKEKELTEEAEANKIPESEWRKPDGDGEA